MGLFDLFNKKAKLPEMKDLIWKSQNAKFNGFLTLADQYTNAVYICWFSETRNNFEQFLKSGNSRQIDIKIAGTVQPFMIENKTAIFLEHYPLRTTEENLIQNWNPKEILILSSLDEPIFEAFGGNRIISMMDSLGMKDDEQIQHSMISKSIKNAQDKLQQKVKFESSATSSKEWFKMNIG